MSDVFSMNMASSEYCAKCLNVYNKGDTFCKKCGTTR